MKQARSAAIEVLRVVTEAVVMLMMTRARSRAAMKKTVILLLRTRFNCAAMRQ